MNIYDLTMELTQLKRELAKELEDIPKNYVANSNAFNMAIEQAKKKYEMSRHTLEQQIDNQLIKIEEKSKLEKKVHDTVNEPTREDIDEGYKVINVIANTSNSISEQTLEKLLGKVKHMDQLALVYDIISGTQDIGLKNKVKNRIQELDSFAMQTQNTQKLIEDYRAALKTADGSLTYTVMNLANQLSEIK